MNRKAYIRPYIKNVQLATQTFFAVSGGTRGTKNGADYSNTPSMPGGGTASRETGWWDDEEEEE